MMYTFIIFILALTSSAYAASFGERIIGGSLAPEGAYPYMASLRSWNRHFCGGSIINERWVMTAAHCITSLDPTVVAVVVGTNTLNSGGDMYLAIKLIVHPDYNSVLDRNDIGLVQVSHDIVFGPKVQPTRLPTEDFTKANHPAKLSGWGAVRFPGGAVNQLQHALLTIVSQQVCLARSIKTTDSNICTSASSGQGPCHGDSGSPLVADGVQVGLVSWGFPCGSGLPDVYTRIWSFLEWINANVN